MTIKDTNLLTKAMLADMIEESLVKVDIAVKDTDFWARGGDTTIETHTFIDPYKLLNLLVEE